MKNKAYLPLCLALSYSLCVVCSEPEYDQNFTRYSHDTAGTRHTTFINEGAKKLFAQHPELEPAFVREAANASTSTRETQKPNTSGSYPTVMPKFAREEIHSSTNAYEQQHRQDPRNRWCTRLCSWMYTRKES